MVEEEGASSGGADSGGTGPAPRVNTSLSLVVRPLPLLDPTSPGTTLVAVHVQPAHRTCSESFSFFHIQNFF